MNVWSGSKPVTLVPSNWLHRRQHIASAKYCIFGCQSCVRQSRSFIFAFSSSPTNYNVSPTSSLYGSITELFNFWICRGLRCHAAVRFCPFDGYIGGYRWVCPHLDTRLHNPYALLHHLVCCSLLQHQGSRILYHICSSQLLHRVSQLLSLLHDQNAQILHDHILRSNILHSSH